MFDFDASIRLLLLLLRAQSAPHTISLRCTDVHLRAYELPLTRCHTVHLPFKFSIQAILTKVNEIRYGRCLKRTCTTCKSTIVSCILWSEYDNSFRYKNSSFGWDPVAKRKELFDKLSRFILVYKEGTAELLAFIMFRFEFEEYEDAIYWEVLKTCAPGYCTNLKDVQL